jgi:hypothetical protein
MGDALLCYKLKSPKLIRLLERGTNPGDRDNRFGRPRHISPEKLGLLHIDYGGFLYYADRGFPIVRGATVQEAVTWGRPGPFASKAPPISYAKMLLAQPLGELGIDDPKPSRARALIQKVFGSALIKGIIFEGPNADLVLHGYYLADKREYTNAEDLPNEFLTL